jgi:hypothetical protein
MAQSIVLNRRWAYPLFDLAAIAFVYFIPALSHMLSFPLYLIEPMRIVVILALVHTHKANALLLAATLPFFTMLVSGHPIPPKAILISGELVINVLLFFVLLNITKSKFAAILSSIVLSKGIYYLAKYIIIQMAVINSGLVSTSLWIQLATTLLFSIYVAVLFKKKASA